VPGAICRQQFLLCRHSSGLQYCWWSHRVRLQPVRKANATLASSSTVIDDSALGCFEQLVLLELEPTCWKRIVA